MDDREPQQEVYTLVVEVGRKAGDGLPKEATGGAFLVHVAARDEEEAVRETVKILRDAGLAPLAVESLGGLTEREAAGEEISGQERALMDRARRENAVIVADRTVFTD